MSAGETPFSVRDLLGVGDRARYDRIADLLGPSGSEPLADVAEDIWRTATGPRVVTLDEVRAVVAEMLPVAQASPAQLARWHKRAGLKP